MRHLVLLISSLVLLFSCTEEDEVFTPKPKAFMRIEFPEKNYVKFKNIINPDNKPRTLCGVDGGHQLDHIYPVYEGFINKISPEELAKVENLRIIPWKENLIKKHKLL